MQLILERRLARPRHIEFTFPLIALGLALIFSGILLWIFGANPLETYAAMAVGAFGQRYHISETILRAIPLMLTGLAVGIAFRMLFWNIGAEGQFVWGVIAATWVALFLPEQIGWLPQWAFLPLMIVAAFAAGAVWGLIPAFLKTALRVNEIITTLMFNYVALLWMQYLYTGSWKDPEGFGFPGSAQFPQHAWLPRLPIDLGRVHYGLVIAIVVAFLIWLVLGPHQMGAGDQSDRQEPVGRPLRRHEHHAQRAAGDVHQRRGGGAGRFQPSRRRGPPAAKRDRGGRRLYGNYCGLAGKVEPLGHSGRQHTAGRTEHRR